jgi:hypothetical protein
MGHLWVALIFPRHYRHYRPYRTPAHNEPPVEPEAQHCGLKLGRFGRQRSEFPENPGRSGEAWITLDRPGLQTYCVSVESG